MCVFTKKTINQSTNYQQGQSPEAPKIRTYLTTTVPFSAPLRKARPLPPHLRRSSGSPFLEKEKWQNWNREPIRTIYMMFVVHRENSALWFIVFVAEYVRSLCFDSSSWRCLVDRASVWKYQVDTARDSAGTLVQHANRQSELSFTTGQRSITGPDNSRFRDSRVHR